MKQLLFLLMMLTSLAANAQDVDETMLVGRWVKTSASGEFRPISKSSSDKKSFQNPDVITFYDEPSGVYTNDSLGMVYFEVEPSYTQGARVTRSEVWWEKHGIQDYFITRNNILHLYIEGIRYVIRFKIIEFDEMHMTLMTMNGKGYVSFVREQPSDIRSATRSKSEDDDYYSLKGVRLKSKPNKEAYIRRGKVYAQ